LKKRTLAVLLVVVLCGISLLLAGTLFGIAYLWNELDEICQTAIHYRGDNELSVVCQRGLDPEFEVVITNGLDTPTEIVEIAFNDSAAVSMSQLIAADALFDEKGVVVNNSVDSFVLPVRGMMKFVISSDRDAASNLFRYSSASPPGRIRIRTSKGNIEYDCP